MREFPAAKDGTARTAPSHERPPSSPVRVAPSVSAVRRPRRTALATAAAAAAWAAAAVASSREQQRRVSAAAAAATAAADAGPASAAKEAQDLRAGRGRVPAGRVGHRRVPVGTDRWPRFVQQGAAGGPFDAGQHGGPGRVQGACERLVFISQTGRELRVI